MKKSLSIISFLAFILIIFLLGSCSKDNLDITEEETTIDPPIELTEQNSLLTRSRNMENSDEGINLECVTILFPFSLVDQAGQEYEVNNEDSFYMLLDSTNGDNYIVDFVFPLTVSAADGEIITVDDGLTLGDLFVSCLVIDEWVDDYFPAYLISEDNSCYSLAFPLTIKDEIGSEIVVESKEKFIELNAEKVHYFVFPLVLEGTDGSLYSVADINGLLDLLVTCNDFGVEDSFLVCGTGLEFLGCYELVFPLELINDQGETIIVEDVNTYIELIFQGMLLDFQYPLTLLSINDQEVIAQNIEELEALLADCYSEPTNLLEDWTLIYFLAEMSEFQPGSSCFNVTYPFSVSIFNNDGTESNVEIGSFDDIINTDFLSVSKINYPVNGTDAQGDAVQISSSDELRTIVDNCHDEEVREQEAFDLFFILADIAAHDPESACFIPSYPVSVVVLNMDSSTSVVDIQSYEEMVTSDFFAILDMVYPIMGTDANGNMLEINDLEELQKTVDECATDVISDLVEFEFLLAGLPSDDPDACFEIKFPLVANLFDSEGNAVSIVFESAEDIALLDDFDWLQFSLAYPVTVEIIDDNSERIIEGVEDIEQLFKECEN